MKGHLRERERGVWELIVPLGRDPITGRYRRVSRTFRGTKREAQRALASVVTEVSGGRETGSDVTVAELMERWLALAADNLSPTTLRGYRMVVDSKVVPALGRIPIRKLRPDQLDALYQALLRDRNLAPATVRQVHAVVRKALGQAVKWGWIAMNPAANATPPRARKAEINAPTIDQLRALIAEADRTNPDFAVFLRLSAATGLRRGEACALRWNDFDLVAGSLVVARSVISDTGRDLIEKDTKTHAVRKIRVDDETVAMLRELRSRQEESARACGVGLPHDAFVFSEVADGSRPWHPDTATNRFEIVRKKVGLEHVRLHDLRHMHATELLAAGVPVRTVSGRLGHANAATTLNVYAHFLEASDAEAATVIGELLASPKPRAKVTTSKRSQRA